jgi:hypothetical protein
MSNPNIKRVGDLDLDHMKVIAYGPPGAGKTSFGATFPKTLFLSAESGLLSVRDRDIDVWTIKSWDEFFPSAGAPEGKTAYEFLAAGGHGYRSVVIDSLTELQKKLHEYIVRMNPNVKRGFGDPLALQDWGNNADMMRKACRGLRDLEMNVVFIALSQDKEIEGEAVVRPALQGNTLPDELVGWVDACVYCPGPVKMEEGTKYLGQILPSKGRRAKVRVPVDQEVPPIIDLSYSALHAVMFPESRGVPIS